MRTLVERLVLILGFTVSGVAGADGSRGAELFEAQCISCHGNAAVDLKTPVLHGQEPAYIARSLEAFQLGGRIDQIMSSMNEIASGLSNEDISALAEYLASQDPCAIDLQIDYGRDGFQEEFAAGRENTRSLTAVTAMIVSITMPPASWAKKRPILSLLYLNSRVAFGWRQ